MFIEDTYSDRSLMRRIIYSNYGYYFLCLADVKMEAHGG